MDLDFKQMNNHFQRDIDEIKAFFKQPLDTKKSHVIGSQGVYVSMSDHSLHTNPLHAEAQDKNTAEHLALTVVDDKGQPFQAVTLYNAVKIYLDKCNYIVGHIKH